MSRRPKGPNKDPRQSPKGMREGRANPGGAKARFKPDRERSANRNEGVTTKHENQGRGRHP